MSSVSLQDLDIMVQIIRAGCQRGLFQADEMIAVGNLYDRLLKIVNTNLPPTPTNPISVSSTSSSSSSSSSLPTPNNQPRMQIRGLQRMGTAPSLPTLSEN